MSKQAQKMRLKLQPHTEFRIREIRSFVLFFVLGEIWKINEFSAAACCRLYSKYFFGFLSYAFGHYYCGYWYRNRALHFRRAPKTHLFIYLNHQFCVYLSPPRFDLIWSMSFSPFLFLSDWSLLIFFFFVFFFLVGIVSLGFQPARIRAICAANWFLLKRKSGGICATPECKCRSGIFRSTRCL